MPPVEPGEAELLARLEQAVRSGEIRLAVDRRKLSHIDFPLLLEADGNRWLYILAGLTALVFWILGPYAGLGAALVSVAVYQTLGLRHVARRLEARVRQRGLRSVETWRRLWRFGGVILTGPDGIDRRGPAESWMALVRGVPPDGTS